LKLLILRDKRDIINLKNLLLAWYLLRSVALRGPLNSLRLLLAERRYERLLGISTAAVKASRSADNYHYQGAPYLPLVRIIGDVHRETAAFHFIDLGCGRGRALVAAAHAGYRRITGIELDVELLETARLNVGQFLDKNGGEGQEIHLVHSDVTLFDYPDEPAVYFLFNPFSEKVLDAVLEKILSSTRQECWFVYMNPRHRRVFEKHGLVLHKKYRTFIYTEAVVCVREKAGRDQASS
jgi:predicted RNA methylase